MQNEQTSARTPKDCAPKQEQKHNFMIKQAKFVISVADGKNIQDFGVPEIAIAGKSNVGKSSFINFMVNQNKLAKTSSEPGRTRLLNYFEINNGEYYFVDLPGYGYAQAGQKQREALKRMIERYCLLREQLVCLFVLVDCRHEPQKIDLEFINWLGENGVPFAIVFTKGDKLGKVRLEENVEAYKTRLLEEWEELPPVFVTSAETKLGGEELTAYIEQLNQEVKS